MTDHEASIRRLFEGVWNGTDPAVADTLVHPDYVIHDRDLAGEFRGPELYRALASGTREVFPDASFAIEDVIEDGDEVDTPRPPDHGAVGDSGVVPPFPLRLADGWLSGELVTSRSQLAAFRAELEAADIPYEVDLVESEREVEAAGLTDRQCEAVEAAVAAGYYEVPRESTLAEVAADLDVDPSVARRLLRRAESRVIRERPAERNEGPG